MSENELKVLKMNILGGMHEYMKQKGAGTFDWWRANTGFDEDLTLEELEQILEVPHTWNCIVRRFAELIDFE